MKSLRSPEKRLYYPCNARPSNTCRHPYRAVWLVTESGKQWQQSSFGPIMAGEFAPCGNHVATPRYQEANNWLSELAEQVGWREKSSLTVEDTFRSKTGFIAVQKKTKHAKHVQLVNIMMRKYIAVQKPMSRFTRRQAPNSPWHAILIVQYFHPPTKRLFRPIISEQWIPFYLQVYPPDQQSARGLETNNPLQH